MSRILPFRKPSARTSPQHEPACVAVNATASGRDLFVEARIRVLGRAYVLAMLQDDRATAKRLWADYTRAQSQRSPAQVTRIETARGLR